jgi:hypothetical protein
MNWGGWVANPDTDPDVFHRLPGWRQKELLDTKKLFDEIPDLRAYETIDPRTGSAYPGQKLARDYYNRRKQEESKLIEAPAGYKFSIPDGVPLPIIRFYQQRTSMVIQDVTAEQAEKIIQSLTPHTLLATLVLTCTARGEGKQIKTSKPVDGVHAYIWRFARYNSGVDLTIPTTCYWDLEDGIQQLTGLIISTLPEHMNDNLRKVMLLLEQRATELIEATGGNKNSAMSRWSRAAGK